MTQSAFHTVVLSILVSLGTSTPTLATEPAEIEGFDRELSRTVAPVAAYRFDPLELSALNLRLGSFQDDQPGTPPTGTGAGEEVNTGQDPTKPVTRLDIRYKYQDLPGGFTNNLITFRVDKPVPLSDSGWTLSLRVDAPVAYNDVPSRDNPNGDREFGMSDSLFQALLITPPLGDDKRWALAFGTQVLFPTGSQDQFGTGKWQLAPTAAVRMAWPEVSKGSFFALLVRDQFSFAGQDERADINDLIVQPVFNWQLPETWFLTFSPEIKFDLEGDGDAFVPFDILVGKMINPRTVASVQFSVPIVDDYPQYDWQVEFRIGFFF